jgi:hypothetical protein
MRLGGIEAVVGPADFYERVTDGVRAWQGQEKADAVSAGRWLSNGYAPPQKNLNLNRRRTIATKAKTAAISPATTQNGGCLARRSSRRPGRRSGVVCTTMSPRKGDPNARLSDNLPGWLLRDTF